MKRAAELLRQGLRIVCTLVRYFAAESCWFSPSVILGGHCGGDPPLSIPNRAVKPAIADGTDPPVGRVGSRRPSGARMSRYDVRAPFFVVRHLPYRCRQRSPIHGLPAARLAYGDDGTAFPLSSVSFRQVMSCRTLRSLRSLRPSHRSAAGPSHFDHGWTRSSIAIT